VISLWQNPKLARYIFYFFLLIGGAAFIYLVRGAFTTFILAGVLVYLLYPVVQAMEYRGSGRIIAILLAYIALLIIVIAFMLYVIPRLINQLHLLLYMLPSYTTQIEWYLRELQTGYYHTELPEGMRLAIDDQIYNLQQRIQNLLVQAVQLIFNLAGYCIDFLLAPVVAFYILKDMERFKSKLEDLLPERHFKHLWEMGKEINVVLTNFIQGNLLLVIIVGGLTGVAMAVIGVEYAVMLGIIAGLAELIPYFGPFIGAVPAVAMGLLQSKYVAFKVIVIILIIQQLEGNILAPKVLGKSVGLHPLFIILALIVGAKLYGIVGMLLAVPTAAIIRILVIFLYRKFVLQPL